MNGKTEKYERAHVVRERAQALFRVFVAFVLCMGVSLPDAQALAEITDSVTENAQVNSPEQVESADQQDADATDSEVPVDDAAAADVQEESSSEGESEGDATATDTTDTTATDTTDTTATDETADATDSTDDAEAIDADETINATDDADSANADKANAKSTLKKTVKLSGGQRYTVTVDYDAAAGIPEGAKLSVAEIVQTPEGYDADDEKWKGRPKSTEKFVSAKKLAERTDALTKAIDIQETDHVFYTKLLNLTITAGGEPVTLAAPVKVTIKTDAVSKDAAACLRASFYKNVPEDAEHAYALEVENLSDDKAEDEADSADNADDEAAKKYKNGAKVAFDTDVLGELGLAGVATPLHERSLDDATLIAFGPEGCELTAKDAWADESVLPDGATLLDTFALAADPDPEQGTALWLAAEDHTDGSQGALALYEVDDEGAIGERISTLGEGEQPAKFKANEVVAVVREASEGETEPETDDADVDEDTDADAGEDTDTVTDADAADADAGEDAAADAAADATADADAAADTDTTTIETSSASAQSAQSAVQTATLLPAQALTTTSGAYNVKVTYGPEAGIPQGSTLEVRELAGTELNYAGAQAERALDADAVTYLRAFDIKIIDPDGNEVEPQAEVNVTICLKDAPMAGTPSVVHLGEGGPEVIDPEAKAKSSTTTLSFPASSFSVYVVASVIIERVLTASDGNTYRITVTCDGASGIPKDANLEVVELAGKKFEKYEALAAKALGGDAMNYAKIFDLSIVGADGTLYQPNDDVEVSIQLIGEATPQTSLSVVHFGDKAEVLESAQDGDTVTFKTDGFSVYAIGDTVKLRTYRFFTFDSDGNYVEHHLYTDSGETTYTQTIKNGDELVVPQLPSDPHSATSTFAGWYAGTVSGTVGDDPISPNDVTLESEAFDFENIPEITTSGETVYLFAKFADFAYVIFHDQYNGNTGTYPVAKTRRAEKTGDPATATVQISDVKVDYDDNSDENSAPSMAFYGWSETPIQTPGEGTENKITSESISITDNKELYPIFERIYWLNYSSGPTGSGATYIPSKYYYKDDGPTSLTVPVRSGYTFTGWYIDATTDSDGIVNNIGSGAVKVADASGNLIDGAAGTTATVTDGKLVPTADTALVANWELAAASYTVVFWRQSVDDDKDADDDQKTYDYAESVLLTAQTGTTVNVPDSVAGYNEKATEGAYYDSDYANFHYLKCDSEAVVKGDGSTVLNVYYDRDLITFTFVTRTYSRDNSGNYYYSNGNSYLLRNSGWSNYLLCYVNNNTIYAYANDRTVLYSDTSGTVASSINYGSTYYAKYHTSSTQYSYVKLSWVFYDVYRYSYSDATVTYTGLYGQPLSKYDYEWPSAYSWYTDANDSINMNYLAPTRYEFTNDFTAIRASEYSDPIQFQYYFQKTDGTEPDFDGDPDSARVYDSGTTTYPVVHRYMFNGLTPTKYKKGDGDWTDITDWSESIAVDDTVKMYYERNAYTITFADSKAASRSFGTKDILYGAEMESLDAPDSPYPGYYFTGWYYDEECTTKVDFSKTMQAADMIVYAGWETEWYLIKIDPNYGTMTAGSTWFWEPYNGDPIEEYTSVTRDYVESADGTYYYVKHDRDYYGYSDEYVEGESSERTTYYTEDLGQATELTTYKRADNAYRYAGWYEVASNGSESLYNFGEPVTHNTNLVLHWKKIGTYYVSYDAGDGTVDGGDSNEELFVELDGDDYSDNAEVVVARTAHAPDGYNFVGWTVRGDDSGTVYHPGESFTMLSKYTATVDGRETIYLDAVYTHVPTAQIVYDANGGTIDPDSLDYGAPESGTTQSTSYDADAGTATIGNLVNNSVVRLSSGNGFSRDGAELVGWSTEPDYDPDTDTLYALGADADDYDYYVDSNDPVTLYAVWQVKAYFHLNKATNEANWGGTWDASVYTAESDEIYSQTIYVGNAVDQPPYTPAYTGADDLFFHYWGTQRYGAADTIDEYDFSTPVTSDIHLYAYWAGPIEVRVHAVDSTAETIADMDSSWLTSQVIQIRDSEISVGASSDAANYTNVDLSSYEYAFAAVHSSTDGVQSISEDEAITALYYNGTEKKVYVKYADTSKDDAPLADEDEVYFVYFAKETLAIGYKEMSTSAALSDATVGSSAPTSTGSIGTYDVKGTLTAPLSYPSDTTKDYKHYAYAIGDVDGGSGVSSSNLHYISPTSSSDDSRPALQVKNTWRGFQYSTDGGSTWSSAGYSAQLYVLYFETESQPTVVTIDEQTIGRESDMSEEFEYVVVVKETTTTTVVVQRQYRSRGVWYDDEDGRTETTETPDPITVSNNKSSPYTLSNGESQSATLFYVSSSSTNTGDEYRFQGTYYRNVTTTTTETTQTITVTQKVKDGFTTTNAATAGTATPAERTWTYTTTDTAATPSVTYTNTHSPITIEAHVALVSGDTITLDDDERASSGYTFDLPINNPAADSNTKTLLTEIPSASLFTGDSTTYGFAGIVYGTSGDAQGDAVTVQGTNLSTVTYGNVDGNVYEPYFNGDTTLQLGDCKVYYLYYPLPKLVYAKEGAGGALTRIQGSTDGSTTTDTITYNGAGLTMNGATVAQEQLLSVDANVFTIGQTVTSGTFNMPPLLDDGTDKLYLRYAKIGVGGTANAASTADLVSGSVTEDLLLYLKTDGDQVKWSLDNSTWNSFDGSAPTVYAIYKEKGYGLQITKSVVGGETAKTFDVTVSSPSITASSYAVTGTGFTTIAATPASGSTPGTINMTVKNGSDIAISGLPKGDYTITESGNANYVLTAQAGDAAGTLSDATVTGNATLATLALTGDKKVALTNTYVICKIVDKNGVEHGFATLQDAVDFVEADENQSVLTAAKTATIQMLVDYDMPATDAPTIGADDNITLTTAPKSASFDGEGLLYTGDGDASTITRDAAFTDASMITNNGTLTLTNITLDGNKDNASATVDGGLVNSAGTLTISTDATLQNSTTSGNGGAVYSSGALTISGATLTGNSATAGGAVYAADDSTVTMPSGTISANSATNGSAIYLYNAIMHMSGGFILNNTGAEDGAVVYAGNAPDQTDSGGKIYFSGAPAVHNNTDSSGNAANVYLGDFGDTTAYVIHTEGTGLGTDAQIGVKAVTGYNDMGDHFATAANGANVNLDGFENDIYGYKGKLKPGYTNTVIWSGFDLTIAKQLSGATTSTTDTFTFTVASYQITKGSYTVTGVDEENVTVTPTSDSIPGTIQVKGVKVGMPAVISDLSIGEYSVTEEACNYDATLAVTKTSDGSAVTSTSSTQSGATTVTFDMDCANTVTSTNTRKTTDVVLTKTLSDPIVALADTKSVDFGFTITLLEADESTPIGGYPLSENVTTDSNGAATITLSPENGTDATSTFTAPVGAIMKVEEAQNDLYDVAASAKDTEGDDIEDKDTTSDNIFAFTVPETFTAGNKANVTFANTRKTADIVVNKTLSDPLKASVDVSFTATLTDQNGSAIANCEIDDGTGDIIETNGEGKATFTIASTSGATASRTLNIPVGANLVVDETPVKETIDGSQVEVYDTTVAVGEATPAAGTQATIDDVAEAGATIAFANTRKVQTITVTKTVNGYSGATQSFDFTASLTYDSQALDYDENDFADGSQTFTLSNGGSKELIVPIGANLKVEEAAVTGYATTVQRGSAAATSATEITFEVSADETVAFTNNELIKLDLVNETTAAMQLKVTVDKSGIMYILNADGTQTEVTLTNMTGTVTVPANETVTLAVTYYDDQTYTVKGAGREGYYLTIVNEPSYHEDANPAIMRVYDDDSFSVSGKLRYGPANSSVTFSDQPLVAFDVNGGAWTTDMASQGYNDRDGDGKVWQIPITSGQKVSEPTAPVYTSEDYMQFVGWTTNKTVAQAEHRDTEDLSEYLYNFEGTVVTGPLELYALWVKETAAVTFDYGEGATWTETSQDFEQGANNTYKLTVEKGTAATKPSNPTLDDYAFVGWTTNAAYKGAHDFLTEGIDLADVRAALFNFNTVVTEDTMLYAVYGLTVTVTFDLTYQEGSRHTWNDTDTSYFVESGNTYVATIVKGDTVKEPVNPTRAEDSEEIAFLKWTTADNYRDIYLPYSQMGTVSGFDFETPVTTDTVLYTSWVKADSVVVTIGKEVVGLVDPNKEFTFTYHIDENEYSSATPITTTGSTGTFALKEGETKSFTIYANEAVPSEGLPMCTQTLNVVETSETGYSTTAITQKLTSTGDATSAGTVDVSNSAYTVEAVNVSGTSYTRWDPNKEGITATYTNTREAETVTVENYVSSGSDDYAYTATLTDGGNPASGCALGSGDGMTTDANGQVTFTISGNGTQDLNAPYGTKLVVALDSAGYSSYGYSDDYTDGDSDSASFTVDSVEASGKITFASGICKITGSDGSTPWLASGTARYPAVFTKVSDAFTAYAGSLYAGRSDDTSVTPAAVKMLVDEYTVDEYATSGTQAPIDFPTSTMTLTTASQSDEDFPYVGVRDRSTLIRPDYFKNCMFRLYPAEVTLENIILDGNNVALAGTLIGALVNAKSGTLNVSDGTIMRNTVFSNYAPLSQGGAIGIEGATVNVTAGLFENLHAKRGGAISAISGTLNLTGTDGSIQFKNCDTPAANANDYGGDGGAIYYSASGSLTVDGGEDKSKPGIVFNACVAGASWGDGGAIYVVGSYDKDVTVKGCEFTECSARVTPSGSSEDGYGGGAINARFVSGLTVSNCSFNSCDAMACAGAVVTKLKDNATASFTNCSFDTCDCAAQGGAVAVYPNSYKDPSAAGNTKVVVTGCEFDNCSSGTQNGSGGAIQSYVPCMEFTDSTFTDCWGGKEGGAINNWYGTNDGQIWSGSYVTVDGCEFVRCRAEDRYYPERTFHYGGGIATKAQTMTVSNSTFTDCVSTLREGGAFCCFSYGADSKVTVSGSTFTGCTAKTYGGAVAATTNTLEVSSDCTFTNCSAGARGGAVYHGDAVTNNKTQAQSTISGTYTNCSSDENGGAIWSRATTVDLDSIAVSDCTAAANGGGVFLGDNTPTTTLTNGTITGCTAVNGGALYVRGSATFKGTQVTGNTVTSETSGAIAEYDGNVKLYFEGNVKVWDNVYSGDSSAHNVALTHNTNTVINTTNYGLGAEAKIGIYAADSNNAYANHGKDGLPFGTYRGAENLDRFLNDRHGALFGVNLNNDGKVYWGQYVCKITDADGNTLTRPNGEKAVYLKLTAALDEFTSVAGGTPVYVKMLVQEYDLKQTEPITGFPSASFTLTTASKSDAEDPYRGDDGTVCTISRANSDKQLFKLENSATTFAMENITFDGRRDKTATTGKFRIIEASAGLVVVNGGTTMQYGNAGGGSGSAICISNNAANLTINSTIGSNVVFDNCVNTGTGGGAIFTKSNLTITCETASDDTYSTTSFTNCTAPRGGAVMIDGGGNTSIEGAVFDNCHGSYEGGAFYHNSNNTSYTTSISKTSFSDCSTLADGHWSYGGAIDSKAGTLEVNSCSFENCTALSNGGAINHGSEDNNRVKTSIVGTTFTNCQTTGSGDANYYRFGGAVYSRAKAVEVDGCAFTDVSATNNGGALYCQNSDGSAYVTISGTSFTNCLANKDGSYGGAVYAKAKKITIQDSSDGTASSFTGCVAKSCGGAVYMETSGSTLNVSGSTSMSSCYADKGGVVYLKANDTMNVSGSLAFADNGSATVDSTTVSSSAGPCIYLVEGSKLNLSGSLSFSNNYAAGEKVENGGVKAKPRQDIYLAGYSGADATSISVAGELTGSSAIWVWPENNPHRIGGKQFAQMASTSISDASLAVFRNALADSITGCTGGAFLSGVRNALDDSDKNIYWDMSLDVSFMKTDNAEVVADRQGLVDAEFTMYTDAACTTKYTSASSADGENDRDSSGNVMSKGKVLFANMIGNVYYMKETQAPSGYAGEDVVYLVLVGDDALNHEKDVANVWTAGALQGIRQDDVTAVTTGWEDPDTGVLAPVHYAVFPIDAETGKATVSVNLGVSGSITNEPSGSGIEVILRKVESTMDAPLSGAVFSVENASGTAITVGTETLSGLKSSTSGVFWVGELNAGTYYLHETTAPTGYESNAGKYFKLAITVTDGVPTVELGTTPASTIAAAKLDSE